MECTLIFPDGDWAANGDIDVLGKQGICLDDWDFMLIVPADQVEVYDREDNWDHVIRKAWRPIDYALQRFEIGCCANTWYRCNFRGKEVAILVAYHS